MEQVQTVKVFYTQDTLENICENCWYAESIANAQDSYILTLLKFLEIDNLSVLLFNDETELELDHDKTCNAATLFINESENFYQMAVSIYKAVYNTMKLNGYPVPLSPEEYKDKLPPYHIENTGEDITALEKIEQNKKTPLFITSRLLSDEIIKNPYNNDSGLLPLTLNIISMN